MHRTQRIVVLAAGLLALGGAAGCGIPFRSPTESPPTPTPAASPAAGDLGTVIIPAETPAPSDPPTARIVTPAAITTVSVTLQTVAFDPTLDLHPGPWSPDGSALVAHVVYAEGMRGPTGHLWTVDAASASPLWDSGDIEDLIGAPVAEWLPDETLALARADAMRVEADGTPAGEISGLEGQIRSVDVSPDGATIFAVGDAAWLIGVADGQARRVQADELADAEWWDGFAWRPDSRMLAVNQSADRYYTVDVDSATATLIDETPENMIINDTPPLWLGDAWVWFQFLVDVLNVDTGATQSIESLFAVTNVPEGGGWVNANLISPDGRYALVQDPTPTAVPAIPGAAYPEPTEVDRGRATFLYDRIGSSSREVEPIFPLAIWSPTSDHYAVLNAQGLAVYAADADKKWLVAAPDREVQHFEWSPDGRWILYYDRPGDLWLVASDGSRGPVKVTEGLPGFWRPITWSLDGQRFAVAVPNAGAVATAEAAATELSAAAAPEATAWAPVLAGIPANLVLVTIQGAGE